MKNSIRSAVENIFSVAAGRPVKPAYTASDLKLAPEKYLVVCNQISNIYGVKISKDANLTIEHIVEICYNCCRANALEKAKKLIGEYSISASELFNDAASIH